MKRDILSGGKGSNTDAGVNVTANKTSENVIKNVNAKRKKKLRDKTIRKSTLQR